MTDNLEVMSLNPIVDTIGIFNPENTKDEILNPQKGPEIANVKLPTNGSRHNI